MMINRANIATQKSTLTQVLDKNPFVVTKVKGY